MKKILVVDDDKDILELLKAFLTFEGHEARVSSSCHQGLSIFYEFAPDLVILDINVGQEDGRDMCRKIKSHAEGTISPLF